MQFHAETQLEMTQDQMERLRLSVSRAGPLQDALDNCYRFETPATPCAYDMYALVCFSWFVMPDMTLEQTFDVILCLIYCFRRTAWKVSVPLA